MTFTKFFELNPRPDRELTTGLVSKPAIKIAVIYEDELTCQWILEICLPVVKSLGADCIADTWWNVGGLSQPNRLQSAVTAATQADVIIVLVRAAEELPLALYVWIDVWLPRRSAHNGTLIALIGVVEPNGIWASHAHTYLQAVARKGRLNYVPLERTLPIEPYVIHLEKQAQKTITPSHCLLSISSLCRELIRVTPDVGSLR